VIVLEAESSMIRNIEDFVSLIMNQNLITSRLYSASFNHLLDLCNRFSGLNLYFASKIIIPALCRRRIKGAVGMRISSSKYS